ncbi:hypothetical protein MKZ38_000701 [Zalerion maritima]|uniref:DUF7918 domain-containing protein n=1 Tax=Zalerion maritima TaxID=339359 RepID=A0AAD5RRU1_9PEZI|nr:hypothetical protein MKZ38_000701 [Zalerion maritima]
MPTMPCFRGIELSIVGQAAAQRFPEFPHPDASSVRLGSIGTGTVMPQGPSEMMSSFVSLLGGSDIPYPRKSKPTVSVYIPSQPGVQFWVKYSVDRPPPDHAHLYFKMYINGRHITSWGINPRVSPDGYVVRAFYEALPQSWESTNQKARGSVEVEGRYFRFAPGQEKTSIAEDGGLIEFNVFRAKAKKRRPLKVELYRDQEEYGIAAPNGGVLENPEEANFYDWYISDPKDSPYTTFRFHYRSWTNLQKLNIIPSTLSRTDFTAPRARRMMTGFFFKPPPDPIEEFDESTSSVSFSPDCSLETEDGTPLEDRSVSKLVRCASLVFETRPLVPPGTSDPVAPVGVHIPQPSKVMRDASLSDRPLPKLPGHAEEPRSRASSITSTSAVSVAGSLVDYVDKPVSEDETVEIGVARRLAITELVAASLTTQAGEKKTTGSFTWARAEHRRPASSSPITWRSISPERFSFSGRKAKEASRDASFLQEVSTKRQPLKKRRSFSEGKHKAFGNIIKDAGDFLGLTKRSRVKVSESEWMQKSTTSKHLQTRSINVPKIGPRGRKEAREGVTDTLDEGPDGYDGKNQKENQPGGVLGAPHGGRDRSTALLAGTTDRNDEGTGEDDLF